MIDGLAVVDKPAGLTSHDVVSRCRRIFDQRRVGHAGTLDPDATGVLLVGLGRATRLLQFLTGLPKCYEGEVVLGVATSSLDAGGDVTGRWDMAAVTLDDAAAAAEALTGEIDQVPPMVSAVKVGGRRLHRLAREGIEVDRPSRRVTVSRFEVREPADADPGPLGGGPVYAVSVGCSSGTYVRALAADLGTALGGGAHLRRLRRTAVGPWTLAHAVRLDELRPEHVRPPAACLPDLAAVTLTGPAAVAVAHGRIVERSALGVEGTGPWALLGAGGDLVAVYRAEGERRARPAVVLAPPAT